MENLIPSVIAFAAGIAWSLAGARHLPPQPWLVVAGLALTILATHRIGDRRLAFSLLLPFFFLLGSLRAIPYLTPPDNDPGHIAGQVDKRRELTISGILKECPTSTPDRSRLLISCEQLIRADGTTLPTHGLVRLSMPFLLPADLEPGDRLLAKAILNRPKSSGTPGAFDYREFLARQSIWVTGWVESPTLIQKVHVLSRPMAERIRYLPERLRHRTGGFLDQTLPPRNSGLYRALLIGDRSTLPPDLSENFTAVGAVHLLAISGMHMGLIALMTTFVIGWLLKRSTKLLLRLPAWKVAGLLAIPPLAGYAMIAGLQIPAVRALVMTVVFLIAILIDRQWSIPVNIALAAFLLLAWRPTILGNAAFQLSFAAVIAIALLYPQASKLLTDTPGAEETLSLRLRRWLVGGLAISIAASIGTLPLLLVHFNRVSLLSPLSTLLLEPFLCGWALCIGLWGCMLIPISAPLAAITLQLGSLGLKAADRLSAALAKLPGISFRLPTPTWPEVAFFYIALFFFSRRPGSKWTLTAGTAAALCLAGTLFHQSLSTANNEECRVTVLDVGQGSSTLLELPHGHAVLIDGGSYLADEFDVGERVIAPFLWHRRIRRLDAVVVSHPHADHYNGLPFILLNFRPKILWINGQQNEGRDYKDLLRQASALGIAVRTPSPRSPLYVRSNTRLASLGKIHTPLAPMPAAAPKTSRADNANSQSLILRLDCGDRSFLFPGDIDREVEEELTTTTAKIDVDVLLAPHHGSSGSMSRAFLAATSPRYLAVSAGASRPRGMASPRAMAEWQDAGVEVLVTSRDGAITFTTNGKALTAMATRPPTTAPPLIRRR